MHVPFFVQQKEKSMHTPNTPCHLCSSWSFWIYWACQLQWKPVPHVIPPVVTFTNRFAVCDTTPIINAVVYELFLGQRKRSTKNWYKLHWPCCLALCPVFLYTLSYFLQYLFHSKIFTFQKFYILILPSFFFLCGDSDLFLFLHPFFWLLPFSCLLAFCNV